MLRNGLSYSQASKNSNRLAKAAYAKAIKNGKDEDTAKLIAFVTYEKEMKWYEGK